MEQAQNSQISINQQFNTKYLFDFRGNLTTQKGRNKVEKRQKKAFNIVLDRCLFCSIF